MNVLPVIVDLLPPPKLDSPAQGAGSSLGGFARILDRTLTATNASDGTAYRAANQPSTPYISPTKQNPEEPRPSASGSAESAAKQEPPPSSTAPQQPTGDHPTSSRSTHQSETRPKGAEAQKGTHNEEKAKRAGASSKRSTGPAASSHDAKHTAQSSPPARTKPLPHATQKSGKKQTDTTRTPGEVLFPGALVLSGAQKRATTRIATKSAVPIGKIDVAKDTQKSTSSALPAKDLPTSAPSSAKKSPAPKGQKTAGKNNPASAAISSQLMTTPLATANSAAAPQAMTMAAHTGPGYSNIQHDPGNAAQNATTNQTAAVTIVDLRSHNQNTGTSTGHNSGHNQPNEGVNVRLFQLANGAPTAGARMSGQTGAAGAPTAGPNFSALTDQVVKQTGILLRNHNSGEIRLLLKPEKLGNLRIKLELNNNNLSGKIFVQNHEALRLVQQNLDSLYRALRDSGFTATSLNVSVGGRDNGERDKERSSPLPSMRAMESVKGFENQSPALETAGSYYSLVNLVI